MIDASLQLCAAIIEVKQIHMAVVRVDAEHTWPTTGPTLLAHARQFFPTHPVLLLSPRVGGFSRSFAEFDVGPLIDQINVDEIVWQTYRPPPPPEPPF